MLLRVTYIILFFLLYIQVNSFEISETTWKDMDNNIIPVTEYCKGKNCIAKCCPTGEIIAYNKKKKMKLCVVPSRPKVKSLLKKSSIDIWNSTSHKIIDTKKHPKYKVFVQSEIFADPVHAIEFPLGNGKIYEDGSLQPNSLCGDKLQYCVDFFLDGMKNTSSGGLQPNLILVSKCVEDYDPDAYTKQAYIAAGMITSAFFMILVLVVYSLIPRLQNIVGMILMAYLFTETCVFILKAAQLIALNANKIDANACRQTTPAVYYFILASFFWLNVMSFDLWWTIRGSRKCRDIHRKGELVKFGWYSLYAWGIPLLVTLFTVAVDRKKWYHDEDYKPPFDSCLCNKHSTTAYVHGPIALMTAANCILFLMTAYNIWLIKRALVVNKESRNTTNSKNRFLIYIKLCVIMGVGWVLELIPDLKLTWHIIVNFYNIFIGVAIFILFVCKRSVLVALCNRFNIKNSFVDKLQLSQYNKSESTRSSSRKSRFSKVQTKDENDTEVTSFVIAETP